MTKRKSPWLQLQLARNTNTLNLSIGGVSRVMIPLIGQLFTDSISSNRICVPSDHQISARSATPLSASAQKSILSEAFRRPGLNVARTLCSKQLAESTSLTSCLRSISERKPDISNNTGSFGEAAFPNNHLSESVRFSSRASDRESLVLENSGMNLVISRFPVVTRMCP